MKADSANKLAKISSIIKEIYGDDLHKKRQLSIAYAAMELLANELLFLHRMAEGLVDTRGDNKKHAAKQIDRLLRLNVSMSIIGKVYELGKRATKGFKESMKLGFDEILGRWNYKATPMLECSLIAQE
jgi:hypothetical protein